MKRRKMNTFKNKEKKYKEMFVLGFPLMISFLLFISFVHASASSTYVVCTDPATFDACYKENPILTNILQIPSPSLNQFQMLSELDARFYLGGHYNSEFAADYVARQDVSWSHADAYQSATAERFFSEDPDHVGDYRAEFEDYLFGKGINIAISASGDITSYSSDGTIVADNGKINIRQLANKYDFIVNADDEIVLIPKGSTKQYAFEGTVSTTPQGDLQIMGSGSFDGMALSNAQYIRVENGKTIISAQKYGDLTCQTYCHMVYNPSDRTYQLKDAVLAEYPNFKLTGTLRVDEQYYGLAKRYMVPAGKEIDMYPVSTNPALNLLEDQGYRISATKEVELTLQDNAWLDHPMDYLLERVGTYGVQSGVVSEQFVEKVEQKVEEGYKEVVKAGIVTEEKKDAVTLDETGTLYMESTDADTGVESYSMALDYGAMYVMEERREQGREFLFLPDDGEFQNGDFAQDETQLFAIKQIQQIVHTTVDGDYGPKTRAAVVTWQSQYNEDLSLEPGMEGYLAPDGTWDEQDTLAYLQAVKKENVDPALVMHMRGGAALVNLAPEGIEVTEVGAIDVDVQDVTYHYTEEGVDRQLQEATKGIIGVPITIHDCGLAQSSSASSTITGSAVAGSSDTIKCNTFTTTQDAYGYESFSQGLVDGTISGSCVLNLGTIDPEASQCASYVTEMFRTAGGRYMYEYYGSEKENLAAALGVTGSNSQMSHNIRDAGGETMWWDENEGMKRAVFGSGDYRITPVDYDQSQFQEGDVIGINFIYSDYIEEATAMGIDERRYTHIGFIAGKETELYTVEDAGQEGLSPDVFLAQQIGTTQLERERLPFYIHGDPIWVNGNKVKYKEENYYYVDALGNPTGSPVTVTQGDNVIIEETLLSHMFHYGDDDTPFVTEEYDRFFAQGGVSLAEHMRPNPEIIQEIQTKGDVTYRTYTDEASIIAALQDNDFSEQDIPAAVAYVKKKNSFPSTGAEAGDVIMIPTPQAFKDYNERMLATNLYNIGGITENYGREVAQVIGESSIARAEEWNLPDAAIPELTEITAVLAVRESSLGADITQWHGVPKLWAEAVAAEVESATDLIGEERTYGLLQVSDRVRDANCARLSIECETPTTLTELEAGETVLHTEASIREGQREIARLYGMYEGETSSFEERLALVALAYHRGEEAPIIASVQQQLNAFVGETDISVDGVPGQQTLDKIEEFSRSASVPFDRAKAEREIAAGTFSIEETEVYPAIRARYTELYGHAPSKTVIPAKDAYIRAAINTCTQVTEISGRCSYYP